MRQIWLNHGQEDRCPQCLFCLPNLQSIEVTALCAIYPNELHLVQSLLSRWKIFESPYSTSKPNRTCRTVAADGEARGPQEPNSVATDAPGSSFPRRLGDGLRKESLAERAAQPLPIGVRPFGELIRNQRHFLISRNIRKAKD